MRAKWLAGVILAGFAAASAVAQTAAMKPDNGAMYCSGMVTTDKVPNDAYIISGEAAQIRMTFFTRDLVYINRGADQGVKEGDRFDVMRPEKKDPLPQEWYKGQFALMRAMGARYSDMGRLRVVHVDQKVSTATVEYACDLIQRGDLVLPFVERRVPDLKPWAPIDIFAPVSTNSKAGMLVSSRDLGQAVSTYSVAYINLGTTEGLKPGSYVRIYRYSGPTKEVVPQERGSSYKMYGWGSAPVKYTPEQLPREILGEAIVLRASSHTATVMVTAMRRDMYVGDYVEFEQ